MSDTQAPSKESVSQSEPTSYLVEGDTYRKLIAERDAYRSVANDLARQLRQRTPADTNAPPERASHEPPAELPPKLDTTMPTVWHYLLVAAHHVVEAVDFSHDNKAEPLKWTVPWAKVTRLRDAVLKAKMLNGAPGPTPPPSPDAGTLARLAGVIFSRTEMSLDEKEAEVAKMIDGYNTARMKEWESAKLIRPYIVQLPGVSENPNEGPVVNGLVQIADGVLPAYYNQWKCSQCGRDPRDVQFNGCGYSQSCGRTALTKFASPK
jgi:hypothetical protein